jgi:LmbE family N-acetylglucosaminyl deacetylase
MADAPRTRSIEQGEGRSVLIVVPHADDLALFIGGTVALWATRGWKVVVARVTDDGLDSVGHDIPATRTANQTEFERAAALLGVSEIIEFGFPTDTLADVSEVALREQIIRAIRTVKPYALVGMDQFVYGAEDNQDHVRVAAATAEAFWTSQFDLHHPEHLAEGLAPHGCFEQWYFGRTPVQVTDVVDISETVENKIAAACAHQTMMRNFFHQLQLQAATGGWEIADVDRCLATGDVSPLLSDMVRGGSARTGVRHGLRYAEEFRVITFGGLETLLTARGRRR